MSSAPASTTRNDVARIEEVLDKSWTANPDTVLLQVGSAESAELIAAKWADQRKVMQVTFKPMVLSPPSR